MEKDKKMNVVVSVLILVAVVAVLVFITINGKQDSVSDLQQVGEEQNINMQNTEQVDGVKITVLKEGAGDPAEGGDVVAMNYTGALLDGTVFDSNVDPKFKHVEPFLFNLGAGQVIKGWDVGIVGMKPGEKRKLEIASDYAYGENGAGGVIPPNATLVFEVELLEVLKAPTTN